MVVREYLCLVLVVEYRDAKAQRAQTQLAKDAKRGRQFGEWERVAEGVTLQWKLENRNWKLQEDN